MKCKKCLLTRTKEDFSKGTKEPCDFCQVGKLVDDTKEVLGEKAKAIAGQLISLSPEELGADPGRVRSMVGEVYRNFGGPVGFASSLHTVIEELMKRRPMPVSVGQLMLNLMKLHHQVEESDRQADASQMNDEQLKRAQEIAMLKVVVEAAGDPSKRKMLEIMLGREGLALQVMDSGSLIEAAASQAGGFNWEVTEPPADEEEDPEMRGDPDADATLVAEELIRRQHEKDAE